jgi:acyl dehydratase
MEQKQIWKIRPEIGQQARLSRTVLQSDITRFTEISGDSNPLHYDSNLAEQTILVESLSREASQQQS